MTSACGGSKGPDPADPASAEPLRVLHIAQKLQGGVGAYLSEILPYQIAALGADHVRVLAGADEREHLGPLPDQCWRSFSRSQRNVQGLASLAATAMRIIDDIAPDIVHLHSAFAGALVRSCFVFRRRPVTLYCSHGWAFNMKHDAVRTWGYARIEQVLAPKSDRILCISEFERRTAIEQGIAPGRLHVVRNGVSQGVGDVEPVQLGNPDRIQLMFVGRIDRQKGLDILEAAMDLVRDVPVDLHVVGAPVLARQESRRNDRCNVVYHGWQPRERIWRYIAAADAVVVPSRWEGFGLAAAEAMRQGKAVIASAVDALPELVVPGRTGFLVPAEDPAALADCIRQLDRSSLREFGENARAYYRQHLTGERMNREILDHYHAALFDRHGPGFLRCEMGSHTGSEQNKGQQ